MSPAVQNFRSSMSVRLAVLLTPLPTHKYALCVSVCTYFIMQLHHALQVPFA